MIENYVFEDAVICVFYQNVVVMIFIFYNNQLEWKKVSLLIKNNMTKVSKLRETQL